MKKFIFSAGLLAAALSIPATAAVIERGSAEGFAVLANTYVSGGDGSTVHGNVLSKTYGSTGNGSTINGDYRSGDVLTLGDGANVNGNAESIEAGSATANTLVTGNLVTGGVGTMGDTARVNGDFISGLDGTIGANAILDGNWEVGAGSVAAASASSNKQSSDAQDTNTVHLEGIKQAIRDDMTNATNDLIATKAQLSAQTPSTTLAPTYTTDGTLFAGVYDAASWSTKAGTTITLDGQGQNDAQWIFNIADILAFGGVSTIRLANVGTNAQVYWNVGSGASPGGYSSIGDGAEIVGIIIAEDYVMVGANAIVYHASADQGNCAGIYSTTSYVSIGANAIVGGAGCSAVTDDTPNYAVAITDTGIGASPGVNDGGDDDAANDIQYVDKANGGQTIIFRHIVTNLGNVIDAFDITVEAGRRSDGDTPGADPFPPGTRFQLLHADGLTPLLDTDGNGVPDTGNMDPDEQLKIVVRAILPGDAAIAADTYTSIKAASTVDPAATPDNDLTEERMAPVGRQRVDIANTAAGLGDEINIDKVNGTAITTINGQTSQVVTFNLFVANEGDADDTYNLQAWSDAAGSVPLPPDWGVEFQTVDGVAITATPLLGSGVVFEYRALVTILHVLPTPNPFDIYFRVVSPESSVSDIKQDAVNIVPRSDLDLTSDQYSAVSPCSLVVYSHRVANLGETSELALIEITSQAKFIGLLWYPVFPIDGVPTVFHPQKSFFAGDEIVVYSSSSKEWNTVQLVAFGDELSIPLDEGDFTYIELRFMVPCDAQLDIVDVAVINASYASGNANPVDNTDITTVSNVNVSLDKQGALDADCNDQPDVDDSFSRDTVIAEPGDCVIWQIVISNLFTTNVCGVEIHDAAPTWTNVYNSGPTRLPSVIDSPGATGPARCAITGDNIDCNVGDDFDIDNDGDLEQNCLLATQTAKVWFSVIVN
jgi:hypothetical protein